MRYIYTFLFYLILPFLFIRLLWRSRKAPDYRKRWGDRLGFCPYKLEKSIWVHAVSVGETLAAIPLIKALKKQYPNIPLIVTNMTPTGAARVKAAFGDQVLQAFVPYDVPDAVLRFLKRVNPVICVVIETELWPNLFAMCKQKNIPMVVTNARLSEKSATGYKKIISLTREMLNGVTKLSSQGKKDAERFIELGLAKEKVLVTGNLKFDVELPPDLFSKSEILRQQLGDRLIWIAASTHPTEEEIVLESHRKILEKFPSSLLILVPRHPDRFNSIAELIKEKKFALARRSLQENPSSAQVYLSDTMGELLLMYSVCDVAFVAGSFVPVGGHNMLEAAVLGKPILMGPQLFNFAEISQMLIAAEGMKIVNNSDELAKAVLEFFNDKNYREKIGNNAKNVVAENRGALQKQVAVIASALARSNPDCV
jgi:3-deoxy-D-manno-octulosonic-acid transferase